MTTVGPVTQALSCSGTTVEVSRINTCDSMSESTGGKKDAFALLMNAGRQQQQSNGRLKRSAGSAGAQQQPKRQCSSSDDRHNSEPAQSRGAERQLANQLQQQQKQNAHQKLPSHPGTQQNAGPSCRALGPNSCTSQETGSLAAAQEALQQPPVDAGDGSAQASRPVTVSTSAGAVNKQAAVEAFRRAFSGGLCSTKRPAAQKFEYLLVYDLEATTNKARTLHPVEIIEISCVIVKTATASITASYQTFVQPTEHPQLDPFCVQLCGIKQDQVTTAPLLADALQQHHKWLQQQGVLADDVSCVPVTWTEWDLKVCLCTECRWRRIQRPDYLCRWVDLKRHYKAKYKKAGNLQACVEAAGLIWEGRAHSGIDDATNTAKLAIHLMRQGVQFDITQVSENMPEQQQQQFSPQGRLSLSQLGPGAAAGATSRKASLSAEQSTQPGSQPGSSCVGSQASPPPPKGKGRLNMAQLAVQKGVSGVFDASGRWLGRCFCGTKAKQRVTKRPGPNHGRQFWSCGCWTITAQQTSSCDFFLWADEVPPGSLKGIS